MRTYRVHPAAMAFPRMPKNEFDELKADIQAHGIRVPILVNKKQDTIIDGRNRVAAAHDLKLDDKDIPVEVFDGTDAEAVAEIVSRNIMRRHLSDDRRAALLAKLLGPQLTKAAEARVKAGKAVESTRGRSWEHVATEAKVSQHKARAALETARHSPTDLDSVIEGKEKLRTAHAKAKAKRPANEKPQKSLRERVEAKFLRMMETFAVTQFREVRTILRELLTKSV